MQKHPIAQITLADVYLRMTSEPNSSKEFKDNFNKKAFMLIYCAAHNSELSRAKYILACYYLYNIGVEKDIHKAFHYFSLAANQGNSKAQFKLAMLYYEENIIENNPNKAFKLFRRSAANGFPRAQYMMAYCLYNSVGTTRNIKEGKRFREEAQKNGYDRLEDKEFNLPQLISHPYNTRPRKKPNIPQHLIILLIDTQSNLIYRHPI